MTRRPNILWLTTDQQRFDTIAALGNPHVSTPVLDQLVAGGTALTHTYCQSPICTPSRASMLTGMYPSTLRANRNGNAVFSAAAPIVTNIIAEAGWFCGNVGKLHLASAFEGPEARAADGYAWMAYSHAPRPHGGYDYADWVAAHGASLEELVSRREGVPPELHQSKWCADESIRFIDEAGERPWLLTVNPFDPHPPFDPPRQYLEMFDPSTLPGPHFRDSDLRHQERLSVLDFQTRPRTPEDVEDEGAQTPAAYKGGAALPLTADIRVLQAAYFAMIRQLDDQFGRILTHLEKIGQRENTLVIFTSDHGEMLGDHGLLLKGARFYEGLVRVPLIFNMPGRVDAKISDALVELTDIAPTLLDVCGVAAPENMQGRSLWPLISGSAGSIGHRDFVRCEYIDAVDLPDETRATMYRDARFKLVVYHGHELGELYDLQMDPWEFDDLWDSPDHQLLKLDLMRRSFDVTVCNMDIGPDRVAPW